MPLSTPIDSHRRSFFQLKLMIQDVPKSAFIPFPANRRSFFQLKLMIQDVPKSAFIPFPANFFSH